MTSAREPLRTTMIARILFVACLFTSQLSTAERLDPLASQLPRHAFAVLAACNAELTENPQDQRALGDAILA